MLRIYHPSFEVRTENEYCKYCENVYSHRHRHTVSAGCECLKMAVYEVFSQAERRRYKTHICSKATVFQFFCTILTFIPPLLVAFRSQGKTHYSRFVFIYVMGVAKMETS